MGISRVSSRTYREIMLRVSRLVLNKQLTETIQKTKQVRRQIDWREIRRQDHDKISRLKREEFEARDAIIQQSRKKKKVRKYVKSVARIIGITFGVGIMLFLGVTGAKSFQNTPAQEYKKAPLKQRPEN